MIDQINHFYYKSPDGLYYYFDGRLRQHGNIGLLPLKFIEDFGPNQNGSTVRDWRINPRTITLDIFLQGEFCYDTRGEQLAKLIDIIRPNRGLRNDSPGYLGFYNDSMTVMEIPVYVLSGPTGDFMYSGSVGEFQVLDVVQFYAPDPIWREVRIRSEETDTESESCLDACLGSSTLGVAGGLCLAATTYTNQSFNIEYTGTWDGDQIRITIDGPLFNVMITNETIGKEIELRYEIQPGEYVIIDISPETVTIVDNYGKNLIGSVTSISDLVDFVLKSPGEITPTGLNVINVRGVSSDISTTNIRFDYYVRHISAYGSP